MVVYSALGHIYVQAAAGRRAASADQRTDAFEFYPSFSRDGQWIVYTTWNDADMGRVRVMRPDGAGGRDVVDRARSLRRAVVLARRADDRVPARRRRSDPRPATSATIPASTSCRRPAASPLLVRDSGSAAEFDHTGTRIYLRDPQREVRAAQRRCADRRIAAAGPRRDRARPQRQRDAVRAVARRQVARVRGAVPDLHRAVPAHRPAGRYRPATQSYPVQRVSRDAGFYLHWSGDSRRLYWTLGPELFTRDLARHVHVPRQGRTAGSAGRAGGEGRPDRLHGEGDMPTGSLALVGARIITMAGLKPGPIAARPGVIENGTIVVEGNRITAVGPSASVQVPAGARRIDVTGKTIMPGIIDVHGARRRRVDGILAQSTWPLAANLAFGVTTSHDPSNDTETVFTNAELIRAGAKLGPAAVLDRHHPLRRRDALQGRRRDLRRCAVAPAAAEGRGRVLREELQPAAARRAADDHQGRARAADDGRARGRLAALHERDARARRPHRRRALAAGAADLQGQVELFAKSKTGYTPTLIVGYGGLSGEYYWYQHTNVWENERLLRFMPREVVDARSRRRTMAPEDDFNHVLIAQGAKQILDAGGAVQLGAHGQLQGLGAHWELWMLQQGGMTPIEAIRAATIDGARYLGLDADSARSRRASSPT